MAMKTNTVFIPIKTKKGLRMVAETLLRKRMKEMEEFEEGFSDGVYAIPREENEPRLNVRKMYAFCNEHGIDPNELSKEQMEQFYIYNK